MPLGVPPIVTGVPMQPMHQFIAPGGCCTSRKGELTFHATDHPISDGPSRGAAGESDARPVLGPAWEFATIHQQACRPPLMRRNTGVIGREVQDDDRPRRIRLRDYRPRRLRPWLCSGPTGSASLQAKNPPRILNRSPNPNEPSNV